MADNLPLNFNIPAENSIYSYSWTDVAEGRGIIKFYGANWKDQSTLHYYLSDNIINSKTIVTTGTTTSTNWEKVLDVDFDITFNNPRNLKGKAYVLLTSFGSKSVASYCNRYVRARIRKVPYGGAEQEIATQRTENYRYANVLANDEDVIEIDVSSLVHFAPGDILRVTIEVWGNVEVNGENTLGFCHDPANRTTSQVTDGRSTMLEIRLPFKIDL